MGGSSLEEQFSKLAANPDIIIATPGRLRHLLDEVDNFTLKSLQFIVFDEGDRLFEMGFKDEINLILGKTSDNHQTLVFSATLPEALAQFTRSGIRDPVVIRLDTEQIISPLLELNFYFLRGSVCYQIEKTEKDEKGCNNRNREDREGQREIERRDEKKDCNNILGSISSVIVSY